MKILKFQKCTISDVKLKNMSKSECLSFGLTKLECDSIFIKPIKENRIKKSVEKISESNEKVQAKTIKKKSK